MPEGHYRLENSACTQRDPDSAGYARQVGPGLRAVLVSPGLDSFTSELYSEVDGDRIKITDEVLAIAVPE